MGQKSPPGGLHIKTVPLWTIEPYGDPEACWGCGLEAEIEERDPFNVRRFCRYCAELKQVDRINQR